MSYLVKLLEESGWISWWWNCFLEYGEMEAAAYGAALQARWALASDRSGQPASLPEIAAAWGPAMQEAISQESDSESVRRYDEVYGRFRRLTDHLKPFFAIAPS